MMTEDHNEVLRTGELGDVRVTVEDRIISGTLRHYEGKDSTEVVSFFYTFAIFPEDARIPSAFFTLCAKPVFGAGGKRPQLQARKTSGEFPGKCPVEFPGKLPGDLPGGGCPKSFPEINLLG